ncbi:DUF489 family protein, partial [Salmonella enterica]|uniref:DUF489 family protein n=1 Tax=Salmonella enterica TaxID=28901 RepID=UPI00398C5BAC
GASTNRGLSLDTLSVGLEPNAEKVLKPELTGVKLSLVGLDVKLSSAQGALNTLGDRSNGLQRQLDHFDLQSDTLMSAMAGIYVVVISPFGPRIPVTGPPAVLQLPPLQPNGPPSRRAAHPSPTRLQ